MAKYKEHIMQNLRERMELEPTDTSKDSEIEKLTKKEVIEEFLSWEGICGYGEMIIDLINDVYGIDLYYYDYE